jgi:hypothetical protein
MNIWQANFRNIRQMVAKIFRTFDLVMYHFFFNFKKIKNKIINVKLTQILQYLDGVEAM